ncbi:unnamed protein product [Protopolystoma xenopodis]|uniref:Uncharacterized protein n=1 Tax=Protopolystoma xenopodis TaxID=117903 RepID=A0A448WQV7_9PLAT|nr:unnamed protein product [Protopolystoma xenopodis]
MVTEDGVEEWVDKSGMPPGLLPEHKASVVLFLERVYGISDAEVFTRLLENGFLPDMRATTLLDSVNTPFSSFFGVCCWTSLVEQKGYFSLACNMIISNGILLSKFGSAYNKGK